MLLCWALEVLLSYRYSRLLDSHRFATFVFRNLYRLQMLAPASSGFSLRVFPVLHRVQQLSSLVTAVPPLASWGCLLGVLSSMSALVLEACSLPALSSAAVVCSGLSLLFGHELVSCGASFLSVLRVVRRLSSDGSSFCCYRLFLWCPSLLLGSLTRSYLRFP